MKRANTYHTILIVLFLTISFGGISLLGHLVNAAALSAGDNVTEAACDASFAAAVNFPTGSYPYYLAKADFNGDGKLDVAVTNFSSGTVSVLLGTGTGSLGAASNFTVGGAPTALAVADLNADGKLDLVVANGAQVGGLPSVAILLGTGTGSFGAAANFPEGTAAYSSPWSVSVGDLNSDNKLDLLVVNSGTLNASILLGTGTGTFGSATNFFVGNGPFFGALGDFNSDGKLDLAVTYTDSSSPFIKIFLGTGTGAFGSPTTVALPGLSRSLAVVDLNGDGKLDLAAAIGDKAKVSVLLGTGAGDFGAATSFPVGLSPLSVAVGDVNGDGKLDLATANAESSNISVLLGTGTGSFGIASTFVAGSSPESLVMGDFNADLKLDLAVANTNSNTLSMLLNNGIPCVTPSPSPSPSPSPTYSFNGGIEDADWSRLDGAHLILTGDTNNDGVTDITRSTTTAVGDHGLFDFSGLPAGRYILTVSADHRLFSPDTRTVDLPTNFPNGSVTVTIRAASATGIMPAGDDIQVTIGSTTTTFHRVVGDGITTLTSEDPNQFVNLLIGLGATDPLATFRISSSADVVPPVEVCFQAPDDFTYMMIYIASGAATNITTRRNDATNTICGRIATKPPPPPPPPIASEAGASQEDNTTSATTTDFGTVVIAKATNAIALSTSNTNVGESAGSASINITRTGDTSAGASIDYATSDAAGSNPCSLVGSGMASSRCDYETTVGTLTFAAGETSKTIAIPIIDDSYADGLESFTVTLTNPRGGGLANPSSATVVVNDNESTNGTNSIDQAGVFVRLHYLDFLNREADASGLGFWSNQITECGANAACVDLRRTNVSAAFFLSIEFQETGYLVYRFYKAGYGNISGLPVPVRLNEFLPDTQQIGRGVVVGAANWQAQLEANKQSYALDFVMRQRFLDAYANSMTPTQFVDALFLKAGVTPTTADRTAAIGEFSGAATSADSTARARSLRRVAENSMLNAQEYNKAFVLMQYFGYLRRNPNDAPDADFAGFNFWLSKLNQFNGNYINAEMVRAFITSGEYRGRFGAN